MHLCEIMLVFLESNKYFDIKLRPPGETEAGCCKVWITNDKGILFVIHYYDLRDEIEFIWMRWERGSKDGQHIRSIEDLESIVRSC